MTSPSSSAPRRLDGRAKVTGQARYAADLAAAATAEDAQAAHAAVVQSTQAGGRVLSIDTSAACAIAGVQLVMTHLDAPRLKPIQTLPGGELGRFLPLQDDRLHYNGQPLAVVIADTTELARYAASLVAVRYAPGEREPQSGQPWSSKALRECYQQAAERIGWAHRDPRIGAMREDGLLIGYGMATSVYHVAQMPASARVRMNADGTAVAASSTHEIGQGGLTALTQLAAEALGLPLDRVRLEWGDTRLPYSSLTAGSSTTLSLGAAIHTAAEKLRQLLAERAVNDAASPLHGLPAETLKLQGGALCADDGRQEPVTELLRRQGLDGLEAQASTASQMHKPEFGRGAFGAQFAKVAINPTTGEIRVQRLVGAFAGGRLVNPLLARSQLMGGMVWGLGQALFERSQLDSRNGRWMNADLSEALVATNADVRDIEVITIEEDDRSGHPLGIKGLGEIGVVGVAAAIANAVFHATGQRIRGLPLTPDKLLGMEGQLPS